MRNRNTSIEMIGQLVATPSISSVLPHLDHGNKPVIDLLAEWLFNDGFHVEVIAIDGQRDKYNLIASKGSGPGGLVLSGHTDTVPTDAALWRFDPFKLILRNERLYGLGTSDMKSFFALAIAASRSFSVARLREPLIILATADEESTMSGAQALAGAGKLQARSAVIGEPTGNVPVRMHKGIMMERVEITGQSGHSSDPTLGKNALEGMQLALNELLLFRAELQTHHRNELFHIPVPTMNLGHIAGGDNPNRICGHCILDFDLRPLPGMEIEELRNSIRHRLQTRLQHSGMKLDFTALFQGIPAMETAADSKLVKLTETLTGHPAEAVAFATEAPYLQSLGMDVVIMGPGRIEQAHQPDEYLEIAVIEPTISLLEQLIYRHCIIGH